MLSAATATHTSAMPPSLILAGAGILAVSTVAGAWTARRRPGHREISFAAAAGALLIIAVLHLLPDAWAGAHVARVWPGLVPIAMGGAFVAAGLAARAGCACQEQKVSASGAATAAALAAHRFLEGSVIALAGAAAIAAALAVHAFAEGLATGALLGTQPRRRVAGWLAVMSISPAIGAATTSLFDVPTAAGPVLLALAAGILTQAAWVSLRAASRGLRAGRLALPRPAAAAMAAAILTAVAVHVAG